MNNETGELTSALTYGGVHGVTASLCNHIFPYILLI